MMMRIVFSCLALALALSGQVVVGNYGISYVGGPPSGSCGSSAPLTVVQGSGAAYTCQNGTWGLLGGGGGGGVSLTGTAPVVVTPNPITGTGNISAPTAALLNAANVFPTNGAASTPSISITGNPFAGTGTTATPLLLLGGGTVSSWQAAGTFLGIAPTSSQSGMFPIDIRAPIGGLSVFSVNSGGAVNSGQVISTGGVTTTKYSTTSSGCAANGSAVSPSIVACAALSTGAISCSAAASGATCQVNTTSIGAASLVAVWAAPAEATRLGVTCNSAIPAGMALVTTKVAASSFTFQLPTFTTDPACYDYLIFN
jgi:hypothetical protein